MRGTKLSVVYLLIVNTIETPGVLTVLDDLWRDEKLESHLRVQVASRGHMIIRQILKYCVEFSYVSQHVLLM